MANSKHKPQKNGEFISLQEKMDKTTSELAQTLGVSLSTVYRWRSNSPPPPRSVIKFMRLKVEINEQ